MFNQLVQSLFAVDSIWSVVFRGAIWLVVSMIIIVATDNPNPDKSIKNLKTNLGFFLMFLTVTGTLIYMLFGFSQQA